MIKISYYCTSNISLASVSGSLLVLSAGGDTEGTAQFGEFSGTVLSESVDWTRFFFFKFLSHFSNFAINLFKSEG